LRSGFVIQNFPYLSLVVFDVIFQWESHEWCQSLLQRVLSQLLLKLQLSKLSLWQMLLEKVLYHPSSFYEKPVAGRDITTFQIEFHILISTNYHLLVAAFPHLVIQFDFVLLEIVRKPLIFCNSRFHWEFSLCSHWIGLLISSSNSSRYAGT